MPERKSQRKGHRGRESLDRATTQTANGQTALDGGLQTNAALSIHFTVSLADTARLRPGQIGMVTVEGITFTLAELSTITKLQPQYTIRAQEPLQDGKCQVWVVERRDFGEGGKLIGEAKAWRFTLSKPADIKTAQKVFMEMPNRPDAEPFLVLGQAKSVQQKDIDSAKWKLTEKRFPKTVELLKKAAGAPTKSERCELEQQARTAYRIEGARLRGDKESYYGLLARAHRVEVSDIRPEDQEMVLNWQRKGYNKMKRKELAAAVGAVTGKKLSVNLYKRAERLGLTTTAGVRSGPRGVSPS